MAKRTATSSATRKRSVKKGATKSSSRKSAAKKTSATSRKKTTSTAKASAKRKAATASEGLMADVRHLMEMMAANDVTEVDIADGERKIAMKRGSFAPPPTVPSAAAAPTAGAPAPSAAPVPTAPVEEPAPAEDLLDILSPMVGTFYAAPSPDSDPYVATGTKVGQETVVCIVEAMKVMNEIKAECSGTIAEICVKNAEPVEFGQVLFRVRP